MKNITCCFITSLTGLRKTIDTILKRRQNNYSRNYPINIWSKHGFVGAMRKLDLLSQNLLKLGGGPSLKWYNDTRFAFRQRINR